MGNVITVPEATRGTVLDERMEAKGADWVIRSYMTTKVRGKSLVMFAQRRSVLSVFTASPEKIVVDPTGKQRRTCRERRQVESSIVDRLHDIHLQSKA